MTFSPDNALQLVADSWETLRPCDLERLLFDTYLEHADALLRRITEQRPDLTERAYRELQAVREDRGVFVLRNDPPAHRKQQFHSTDNRKQAMLLTGLDCLPGQEDLF